MMDFTTFRIFQSDWNSYNENGFENIFTEDVQFTIPKAANVHVRKGNDVINFFQSLVSGLRNFHQNKATVELVEYAGEPCLLMRYYLHSEFTSQLEATVYYLLTFTFAEEKIASLTVNKSFDMSKLSFLDAPINYT